MLKIRHLPGRAHLRRLREQLLRQDCVCVSVAQRPEDVLLPGGFENLVHGLLGDTTASSDVLLAETQAVQPQNLSVLGHGKTSL